MLGCNMGSYLFKLSVFITILSLATASLIVLDYYRETAPSHNITTYQIEQTEVKILAPYGQSNWGPFKDGVLIVGSGDFSVLITIYYPKTATETLKNITVWADTVGVPAKGNVTFHTSNQVSTATRYDSSGKEVETIDGTPSDTYVYFKLDEMKPGDRWEIRYWVSPPSEQKISSLPYTITLQIKIQFGEGYTPIIYPKPIRIINRPLWRLVIIWILALGTFAGVLALGYLGFFKYYSTLDIVSIALIGAIMVVWVQILGRQLIFPAVDRIPMSHNFAVADFPFVLLLVTAIGLVKKPGTASLTLFIYNVVSEIGWYGLNVLWWAYPFAQGIPVDIYLFLRGKGVLSNKMTFFKFRLSEEGLEESMEIPGLGYLDGFVIGFLRGFFMQVSLYLVFYPNLFRIEFFWEYVFWWHVVPWTIGNAISAAISVPIVDRIEEAITY